VNKIGSSGVGKTILKLLFIVVFLEVKLESIMSFKSELQQSCIENLDLLH
jgi:hypothetical protein